MITVDLFKATEVDPDILLEMVNDNTDNEYKRSQIAPYITDQSIVLKINAQIIGACLIKLDKNPKYAIILVIFVIEKGRRNGFGSIMINELKNRYNKIIE